MTPGMELALVTFAAVVVAQLGKAGLRMLQAFVKKTPTNLDDKILAAVSMAVQGEFARAIKETRISTKTTQAGGGTSESVSRASRDTDKGMTK